MFRKQIQAVGGAGILATLCLCCLIACTDTPSPPTDPHVAALTQVPAYQLAYPGAMILQQGSHPPSAGLDGRSGATAGKVYGIPAPVPAEITPQVILAWYHTHLQAQGWSQYMGSNLTGYQAQEFWLNARYYIRIGIYAPKYLRYYLPSVDPSKYPLVFNVSIGERGYQGG